MYFFSSRLFKFFFNTEVAISDVSFVSCNGRRGGAKKKAPSGDRKNSSIFSPRHVRVNTLLLLLLLLLPLLKINRILNGPPCRHFWLFMFKANNFSSFLFKIIFVKKWCQIGQGQVFTGWSFLACFFTGFGNSASFRCRGADRKSKSVKKCVVVIRKISYVNYFSCRYKKYGKMHFSCFRTNLSRFIISSLSTF